eukprot:TRINITY_DN80272_c0_g1_i1.p1 TRINITY_DN80272_c0_g1~~TRINITY_DN80272_c0_g1_i1.p1  ORF type:complete len:458 (+),score=49.23 TRINITY_DN80272_c0_g1_i1:103-1374(+)
MQLGQRLPAASWHTLPQAVAGPVSAASCSSASSCMAHRQYSAGAVLQASGNSTARPVPGGASASRKPVMQAGSSRRMSTMGNTPTASARQSEAYAIEQSPEEGFRKRRGEGKSSGGGPSSIEFSTPGGGSGTKARRAAAVRERGSSAVTARSAIHPASPGETKDLWEDRRRQGLRGRASTGLGTPGSPRDAVQSRADEAQRAGAPPPRTSTASGPASSRCSQPMSRTARDLPSSPWPLDQQYGASDRSLPRDDCEMESPRFRAAFSDRGRSRAASSSPPSCIPTLDVLGASARSGSPDSEAGFKRRSGAGRSSGGGPSSICLGELPAVPPPLPSFERDIPPQRSPRESITAWPSHAESLPCRQSSQGSAMLSGDPAQPPSYDELIAENRHLRLELASTQAELERYRDWYHQLSSSYHNGNGFL